MADKKKPKQKQKFKESYLKDFHFIIKSRSDDFSAHCRVCHVDFSICWGGKNDITKHEATAKHKKNALEMTSNVVKKTMKMDQLRSAQWWLRSPTWEGPAIHRTSPGSFLLLQNLRHQLTWSSIEFLSSSDSSSRHMPIFYCGIYLVIWIFNSWRTVQCQFWDWSKSIEKNLRARGECDFVNCGQWKRWWHCIILGILWPHPRLG